MALADFISLLRLSPYNLRDSRRVHVVLRTVLDCSGKAYNPKDLVVTLAGFGASESLWPEVELAWHAALLDMRSWPIAAPSIFEDPPRWHTSKARHSLNKSGAPEAFFDSVWHLLKAMSVFRTKYLIAYSASVVLADYERAKLDIPSLRAPEALCVDGTLGRLSPMTADDVPIIVYFDGGEDFLKQVIDVWLERRAKFTYERVGDWSRQIKELLPLRSAGTYYPMQLADLYAWIIKKHYAIERGFGVSDIERRHVDSWAVASLFVVNHVNILFDYDMIIKRYGQAGDPHGAT